MSNDVIAAPKCLLCGSNDTREIESINVADLCHLYRRDFGDGVLDDFKGYERTTLYVCGKCDLRFFSPAKAGSGRFYAALQRTKRVGLTKSTYYLDDKEEYNVALRLIRPGAKVLEVGAGKGAFGSRIKSTDYVGLELSEDAVKMAATQGVQVRNELVQAHALGHKGQYDVVCAFQVLEHVVDLESFIGACIECLKPGAF